MLGGALRRRFDEPAPPAAPAAPVTLGEGGDARLLSAAEALAAQVAGGRVLLVAAGDGGAAVPVAPRAGLLVATEADPDLRDRGVERLPAVEWHGARPRRLPFESESFDAALAFFGATYERDQRAVAAELARVTRPGGTVAITAWAGETARRVNGMQPPGGPRPGAWSRYETAYRLLFGFDDLDVVEHDLPAVGTFAIVAGRRPAG